MRTKNYVAAYIIKRGGQYIPRAKVIEAANAYQARESFNEWYYSRDAAQLPHPFHITVKRLDGLAVCPLCGSPVLWKGDAVECQRFRCGLTVHLPASD